MVVGKIADESIERVEEVMRVTVESVAGCAVANTVGFGAWNTRSLIVQHVRFVRSLRSLYFGM